jgi:hypothetical protein
MEPEVKQETVIHRDRVLKLNNANQLNHKTVSIIFGTCKTSDYQLLLYSKDAELINELENFSFPLLSDQELPKVRLVPPCSNTIPTNTWSYATFTKQEICSILYFSQMNQMDDMYLWKRFENKDNALYFILDDRRTVYKFTIDGLHRLRSEKLNIFNNISIDHSSFIATNSGSFAFIARQPLTALLDMALKN